MHIRTTARRVSVLAAVGLLASVAPLLAQGAPRNPCRESRSDRPTFCEVRAQVVAAPGGVLTVDAVPNGGITIHGWNRPDISVEAKVEARADTEDQARALAAQVRVLTDGGRIRAEGPRNEHDQGWSVSFDVMVPSQGDLDLQSTNGGISVTDVRAKVTFHTTNGGITLKSVNGDVRGATTNGGVRIELDGTGWYGEGLDVETLNGGVHLTVPDGYSAHLEAGTVHGGISASVPTTAGEAGRRRVSTDLGQGGAPIKLRTTNGGVSIDRR